MHAPKLLLPLALVVAGVLVNTTTGHAKAEYTKKEKKPCTFCHVAVAKPKELTEAGKYYGDHAHSLEGYKPGAKSVKQK